MRPISIPTSEFGTVGLIFLTYIVTNEKKTMDMLLNTNRSPGPIPLRDMYLKPIFDTAKKTACAFIAMTASY